MILAQRRSVSVSGSQDVKLVSLTELSIIIQENNLQKRRHTSNTVTMRKLFPFINPSHRHSIYYLANINLPRKRRDIKIS